MRTLVIGGSGFIGRYLVRRLVDTQAHEVSATCNSRPPGDAASSWHRAELADTTSLEALFRAARPETVLHLAAMADVGACEREPERATAINATATAEIARLCAEHGSRLVFVSTEYVFDGRGGPYREDADPAPTTQYGKTKVMAEQAVREQAPGGSIVRTSIVYGWPAPGRRNFATWLVERLQGGQTYVAPPGVMRSPVYVEHLVDGMTALAERESPGIHHVAGRDWVSMHDFALAIADGFGLDRGLVVPGGRERPDDGSAPDSRDILGLDSTATMRRLGLDHPGLAEGIAAMRRAAPAG